MEIFFIGLLIIFCGFILSIFFSEKIKIYIVLFFSLIGIVLTIILPINVILSGKSLNFNLNLNYPIGLASFEIDLLSAFFIVIICMIGFFNIVYNIGYLKEMIKKNISSQNYLFFYGILYLSMILIVCTKNAIIFLILWEIMALSSFFIITLNSENKKSYMSGIVYLIAMHISFIFLSGAFIVLASKSGSFSFDSFKNVFKNDQFLTNILFILFFIGFAIKAEFAPFHYWFPKVYPIAHCGTLSLISSIMIKIGIYGLLRIILLVQMPSIFISYFVLFISLFSCGYGIIYSLMQKNIKNFLTYSSVENIGIIGTGIGIGMLGLSYQNTIISLLGFAGALFHILNHSIFKSILFFGLGNIILKTEHEEIESLGGLTKKMRTTSILFLIGCISVCALPPFNGFISEFIIYNALLNGMKINQNLISIASILSIGVLSFIGSLAIIGFTMLYSVIFLGNPRTIYKEEIKEVNILMLVPMFANVFFVLFIGLFPQFVFSFITRISLSFMSVHSLPLMSYANFVNLLKNISFINIIFLVSFLAIFLIRNIILLNKPIYKYKTWDCGYQGTSLKLQYTAFSFISPFLELIKQFIPLKIIFDKPKGLFPKQSNFGVRIRDFFDYYIVRPFSKFMLFLMNLFSWIQTGNMQLYLLYGLIFLFVAIVVIVGVK